jgi:Na+-translocating ferredoxin:NAD+ oxidoreductase subunit G
MKSAAHIILTLTLIGLVSGGVLSQFNTWALPQIAENQRLATERAIYYVQPDAARYELVEQNEFIVYHIYAEDDAPLGYVLLHAGSGFQSTITIVIGLKEDLETITGIEILDQNETPGLGTVIREDWFKDQFRQLSTVPEVAWVKGVPPVQANEVQIVTGATISTRAVVEIVNEGISELRRLEGQAK